jgi:hypothetical protein
LLLIAFSANVCHLAALEVAFEFFIHCAVRDHVCTGRITILHDLLSDEVQITVDLDTCGVACFCHAHAVQDSFVLSFVVGGFGKSNTKDVAH